MKTHFEPQVYLIGQTEMNSSELDRFLKDHNVPDWKSDAAFPGERIPEVAGRVCYMSFEKPRPGGNSAYLDNIKVSRHGSVTEHPSWCFIFAGVSRTLTHELVRHRAGWAYCLAGDTEVWSGRFYGGKNQGSRKRKIKDIFAMTKTPHGRSRLRLLKIRCYDGEKFTRTKIAKVVESGEKDIVKVTLEDGKTIRCSEDHRFLTPDGWAPVKYLVEGEPLATNGVVGWKHSKETKELLSRQKTGAGNPQWKGDKASQQAGRLRAQKLFPAQPCEVCGKKDGHRHHKDRNALNNHADNVQFLCGSCHNKLHTEEDGHSGALRIKWIAIKSIEPDGKEMTYDIEVEHPCHNFVANGFVTHNSQLSQRYVDESVCEVVCPLDLKQEVQAAISLCELHKKDAEELLHQIGYNVEPWAGLEAGVKAGLRWLRNMLRANEDYRYLVEYLNKKVTRDAYCRYLEEFKTAGTGVPLGKEVWNNIATSKMKTEFRKTARQAARSVLPNATETKIFTTANARAWRHFIEMRASRHAEPEIRQLAYKVWQILVVEAPNLFNDYKENKLPDGTTELTTEYRKV